MASVQLRDLDTARDFGRHLNRTHLLQSINNDVSTNDILPILDVSEQYEVAQAKKVSISGLYNGISQLIAQNPASLPRPYGAFSSTLTQTNATITGVNIMTVNTSDLPDGVTVVSGSQFTPNYSGVYNLQFSAQIAKDTAVSKNIEIFLRKNGQDIPNSNTIVKVDGSNARTVAAWNYLLPLASGEYVQLAWYSDESTMRLLASGNFTNPTRPDIPSLIVSMTLV